MYQIKQIIDVTEAMLNVTEAMVNVTEAMLNVAEAMLKCYRGYDLQYTISRDAIASKKCMLVCPQGSVLFLKKY